MIRTVTLGLLLVGAVVALAAPAAARIDPPPDARDRAGSAVAQHDLRSPDTRDAGNRYQSPPSSLAGTTSTDRGSREARASALAQERYYRTYNNDANAVAAAIAARQDLRSPDTRDIAQGREHPPTPTVITLTETRAPEATSSGFDWIAALAGACASLGLVALTTAAALTVSRHRAHHDQPAAAT